MRRLRHHQDESAFISVEIMVATAFSILFLVMMTNFVVIQFARGVVRAAADEGARAGARVVTDPIASCNNRAHSVIDGSGKMVAGTQITCAIVGDQIQATALAKFQPWMPGIPVINERVIAISHKEEVPQ